MPLSPSHTQGQALLRKAQANRGAPVRQIEDALFKLMDEKDGNGVGAALAMLEHCAPPTARIAQDILAMCTAVSAAGAQRPVFARLAADMVDRLLQLRVLEWRDCEAALRAAIALEAGAHPSACRILQAVRRAHTLPSTHDLDPFLEAAAASPPLACDMLHVCLASFHPPFHPHLTAVG